MKGSCAGHLSDEEIRSRSQDLRTGAEANAAVLVLGLTSACGSSRLLRILFTEI